MSKNNTILMALKYLAIFVWLGILIKTDSYFSVYLVIGIIATISVTKKKKPKIRYAWLNRAFTCFFSVATTLANYQIFAHEAEQGGIHNALAIFTAIITLICGFIVFQSILPIFQTILIKQDREKKESPTKTFFFCFTIFCLIDLAVLFICCYPGSLTPDSIDEIGQILSGHYSNHHPFYYTILIYPFITIGTNVFHDINAGVALFNVFQILILSAAFSYSISTLQRIGIPKKILCILLALLVLLPYNIIYSFTIWKDVLFGAFFLIFIVTLYRYFNEIYSFKKSSTFQLALLAISGLAVCLFRSNALIAIFVSVIIFFIMFRKKYLKLGILLTLIVIAAFILKRPVLQQIDVKQTDTIESLSIPSQQIVKTLKYNKDQISEEDISLINNLADPDALIAAYTPTIHDPVKKVIRDNNNQDYLKEHIFDYVSLYIKLGLKYPLYYLTAWIDQTRGYWNGGYSFWIWANEVQTNDYGIERKNPNIFGHIFNYYIEIFHQVPALQPLISIGLTIWIIFILLYRSILDKTKTSVFMLILILTTWLTLLIATPVFCEFRYAYFIFTTTPFLILTTFTKKARLTKFNNMKRRKNEKR